MRRLKPRRLVIIVGVLLAFVLVPASGIVPRITEWHDRSSVSRPDFVDVPDPIYWMFYTVVAIALFSCAWLIVRRVRNYERGQPDDRSTTRKNVHRRLRDFRSGVWMRTLLRDPAAGVMHSFIYFGFLVLFVATVILEINHQIFAGPVRAADFCSIYIQFVSG